MADPTFPYLPFSAGNTIDPSKVWTIFYDDDLAGAANSLQVICGGLDEDNLAGSFNPGPEHLQPGAAAFVVGSSGTANLDFKDVLFGEYETEEAWAFDSNAPYHGIPGGSRTVYLPWAAQVLVTWSVFWTAAAMSSQIMKSDIFLMVDEDYEDAQMRRHGRISDGFDNPEGYKKSRVWTGHALLELEAGWHDIGLCILADKAINMTRVHAVNIDLLCMKFGGAT